MEISLFYAALAGFGYALAAMLSKRALHAGAGILRLSFVMNLVFVAVFAAFLWGGLAPVPWEKVHQPLGAGIFFFGGQIFTFAAIRTGDVSLQTPVMGTKAVFVVLIAVALGTEPVDARIFAAAVLSAVAVALLGFSGGGARHVGRTLVLALLSALFFACADTMVGTYGLAFGPEAFLILVMAVNGLLSFALIPFFHEPLRRTPRSAVPWLLLAALGMAGQALLLNDTLARYQQVAPLNILYSSRGLWSVVLAAPAAWLLCLPGDAVSRRFALLRLVGALLMSASIALVLAR